MRPHVGRTWGKAAIALIVGAGAVVLGACGDDEEEPPGSTPGSIEPIGELAGPSVPLDDQGGYDNILALTIESAGDAPTLIVGQAAVGRPGPGATQLDAESGSLWTGRRSGAPRRGPCRTRAGTRTS